jgi:dTDP-4-dehydrorhamnose 3,5-epimerase
MRFTELDLPGAYLIDLEPHQDSRGFFARTWCQREFAAQGLVTQFVQGNLSFSRTAGTLRGMHYQVPPHAEVKLVRCTRGAIHDVIADVRPESPTYRRWAGVDLSAAGHRMLYVPTGFAHGFITLEDDSEVTYQVSAFYAPGCERGIRFDDPALAIRWPRAVTVVSDKDRAWPDYAPAQTPQPAGRVAPDAR